MDHSTYLRIAMEEAERGLAEGGPAIGSIIVNPEGRIVGRGRNRVAITNDPTAHAEIDAIRNAGADLIERAARERLTLYTTAEPCLMCIGAIVKAEIDGVVWAVGSSVGSANELLEGAGWLENRWGRLWLLGEPDADVVREMGVLRAGEQG